MGANNGSGWPLYFACAKCRKGWTRAFREHGHVVVRTGRTRPYKGGNKGARGLNTFHEYRCTFCGHIGWSRHVDIAKKPLQEKTHARSEA